MRSILGKTFIAVVVMAVAAFGADSSIGTWKLNLAKSKYGPPPMPVKSLTSVREAADGGTKVTMTGERANGDAINSSYVTKYDGSPSAVTGSGSPYDTMSVKREGANKFSDERTNKGTKYHVKGKTEIEDHDKVMKSTFGGIDPEGKKFKAVFVWDKQ